MTTSSSAASHSSLFHRTSTSCVRYSRSAISRDWHMAHPYWPLYDVVVRTPRLELRLPDEDQLVALATLSGQGVHDPSWMPMGGWTDQPSPQLERGVLHWHWGQRANWRPDHWSFDVVVLVDDEVVGNQG